jgi:Putative MetA-pathway of phenol degradation
MLSKRFLSHILLLPGLLSGPLWAQSQETEVPRKDGPIIVGAGDVDDTIKIEVDAGYSRDHDGSDLYSMPVLIRFDTGRTTELRLRSNFLSYDNSQLGFSDVALGFKWNFREGNPNMAIIAEAEFPTGTAGFEAPGMEYNATLALDYRFDERWGLAFNVGSGSAIDDDVELRYFGLNSSVQLGYKLDDDDHLGLGLTVAGPDAASGGQTNTLVSLGYSHAFRKEVELTLYLGRRLSNKGPDFAVILGYATSF